MTSRSKYHALPTVVDGIRFASRAEARRYRELTLLARAGTIDTLELQPRYVLSASPTPAPDRVKVGEYRADFRYRVAATGALVVEDVKGMDTPLSAWKRKHTGIQYDLTVEIVR